MNEIKPKTGLLCYSKSGRDSGRYFVIVQVIDDDFVLIVDGKTRHLSKPKKKKIKHLKLYPEVFKAIADKLEGNLKVFDSEIYSILRPYNEE